MPQALVPALVSIGLSTTAATVASAVIYAAGTYFVSDLLRGGPPKPDAAERTRKDPKPARIHVLGHRRVYGASMLFTNTSDSETVDVWAFCEGPINAVTQPYLNDDRITIAGGFVQALSDGSYGDDKVLAGYNLGADPNTAHAAVVSRVAAWTSDHRGDGIVSGYLIKTGVKSKNFLDTYPQGDNTEMSLAIEGHSCHDPREPSSDPDDPATWSYTENSALLLLWFKTVFKGADYATRIAPVEQFWIDAADICDEAMSLDAGGTEPRYRGCIVFAADANPADIENEILATFDGWTAEDENGCIKVFAGKLYEPTVSIGPEQIIDYELQEFVEDENRVNETIVRHISADHDFNEVECEPWRDESDITERGRLVSNTLNLQVPSHTQGRRLAKRRDVRINAPQRGTVRVVFSAREALAERYINLMIEEAGTTFFEGRVEVVGGERDHETGGAVIEWIAVDENTDAWTPATDDGEPAPSGAKYYIPPLETPEITDSTLTEETLTLEVDGPVRDDLTWFVQMREQGATAWGPAMEWPDVDASAPIVLEANIGARSGILEVQVSYQTGDGRVSAWSATEEVDAGDGEIIYDGGDASGGL